MEHEARTSNGTVAGKSHHGVISFLGVPFAEPPFGPNRFLAPVPVAPWDGTRPCLDYGATAPQPSRGFTIIPEPIIEGADCLNLNVFTPSLGDDRLPVLVWIHGGGFTNGCNASPWYDGRSFARDGVVVAAVNYRLGAEGFLPIAGAPDNRGVLDWLAALEWVHDNIAGFGGDPSKVTIAGQSAGGVACATLLSVPRARGLFHRAILMSGAAALLRDREAMERVAEKLAAELGAAPTKEAFASRDPQSLVAAQIGTARALGGDVTRRLTSAIAGGLRYGPVVDGDVVPQQPRQAVSEGAGADVPVLVGATEQEMTYATRLPKGLEMDAVRTAMANAGMSPHRIERTLDAYDDLTPAQLYGQLITDGTFRIPAVRFAEARAEVGAPTWLYEFQWRSPTGFGSIHCLDIPFAFDVLDADKVDAVAGSEAPGSLANGIHSAWVRFVGDGDPGWERYDPSTRQVMVFDTPSRVEADPHAIPRDVLGEVM